MSAEMTETMAMPHPVGTFFPWWLLLLQGLIALIIGIFLLAYPFITLVILFIFLGAYWFVSGIFTLVSLGVDKSNIGLKIVLGILGIILGLLFLTFPIYGAIIGTFAFVIIVGIWALIYGFIAMYSAFTGKGWGIGILGLLSILFGIIILANPLYSTLAVPFVFGILGIIFGFAAIIGSFMLRSAQKAA
jgi:uncharacterized membrane protein HdeD (DUF308 family)